MGKFQIPSTPPTVNKTIRFPSDVVEEVEKAMQGKNCSCVRASFFGALTFLVNFGQGSAGRLKKLVLFVFFSRVFSNEIPFPDCHH